MSKTSGNKIILQQRCFRQFKYEAIICDETFLTNPKEGKPYYISNKYLHQNQEKHK